MRPTAMNANKGRGASRAQDRVDHGGRLVDRACLEDGSHLGPQPAHGCNMTLLDPGGSLKVGAVEQILDQGDIEVFGPVDDILAVHECDGEPQGKIFVMRELHLTYYLIAV